LHSNIQFFPGLGPDHHSRTTVAVLRSKTEWLGPPVPDECLPEKAHFRYILNPGTFPARSAYLLLKVVPQ